MHIEQVKCNVSRADLLRCAMATKIAKTVRFTRQQDDDWKAGQLYVKMLCHTCLQNEREYWLTGIYTSGMGNYHG